MADENPSLVQPAALLEGRFEGPAEFSTLIRCALATAALQGWRSIVISDSTFGDWPLGERGVAQSLHDWASSGRKLTMLAKHYDEVVRRHSRFVTWRRTWSHIIECRANAAVSLDDMPSAFWSPAWACQRLDLNRSTGIAGFEAARRVALRERLDECLRHSTPAFAATTLGL